MTDYGYCHARIRGMKSELLDNACIDRMLRAGEAAELANILEKTVYEVDIHRGLLRHKGAFGIEEGLRLNLSRTFQTILGLLDDSAKGMVELLLARWDVQNIKTVLRGKHVGALASEIISSFVPVGVLPESTLVALANENDIKATIDLMATWGIPYSKPLTAKFSTYVASGALIEMETALDRFYYKTALAKLNEPSFEASLTRNLIQGQIDFANIMTLLRLANEKTGNRADDFFVEGGREVPRERFLSLAKFDRIDEVISSLRDTSYSNQLNEGLEVYRAVGSFAAIERSLEDFATKKVISLFRAEPLSLAVIIAYLWAKVNEVINIRIILRANEAGMPIAAVREALVLV